MRRATFNGVVTGTLLASLGGFVAAEDDPVRLTADDLVRSMHSNPTFEGVPIFPADGDLFHVYEDVCYYTGVNCGERFVLPMFGKVNNALAFLNEYGDEVILIDPRFFASAQLEPKMSVGHIGAFAVFAHELGHHVAGHLKNRRGIPHWQAELEADAFMGFAVKQYSASMSRVIRAFEDLGISEGSATHPPLTKRVRAISIGFESRSALQAIRNASQ